MKSKSMEMKAYTLRIHVDIHSKFSIYFIVFCDWVQSIQWLDRFFSKGDLLLNESLLKLWWVGKHSLDI